MFRPLLRLYPVFLVAALICGLFGFGTASGVSGDRAMALFVAFCSLAALALLGGWLQDVRQIARRGAAWRR